MASSSFSTSNGNQTWLRQRGSVKEFNVSFDEATSNLQLPEEDLVVTYVAGLKDEIAESVRFFNPLTMREARSIARAEEIFLQWRREKARRDSADQEGRAAQEKGVSCSTHNQEVRLEMQEPPLPIRTSHLHATENRDVGFASDFRPTGTWKGSVSTKPEGASVIRGSTLSFSSTSDVGYVQTRGGSQYSYDTGRIVPQIPSISSSSTSIFSEQGSTVSIALKANGMGNSSSSSPSLAVLGCFLPLNSISSSMSMIDAKDSGCELSTPAALGCFLPLSSFSSLQPLFQLYGERTLQSEDQVQASRWTELVASVQMDMWLKETQVLFEKLNNQLALIFTTCQRSFGDTLGFLILNNSMCFESDVMVGRQLSSIFPILQLASNFSRWEKYAEGSLNFLIPSECLGFYFEENGPSLLLQLGLKSSEYKSDGLMQNWHLFLQCSPTQSLLQTWFRGELIRMLFGSGLDLLLLFVPTSNK